MSQIKTFECLPYLPRREVVWYMGLLEILDLSLSSPFIKNAAKSLRLSFSELKWLISTPGHFVIHLIPTNPNEPKIIFKLAQKSSSKFFSGCLNGKKCGITRSGSLFTVKCGPSLCEKIELLDDLTSTILEIFTVEKFHVKSNLYTDFLFKHSRKFETFSLSCQEVLTVKQMRMLMEGIEVDIFKLESSKPMEFGEIFELNHRETHLPFANWLISKPLLSIKCEKLVIGSIEHKPRLQPINFVNFVSNWMNGGMDNLKFFELNFKNDRVVRYELREEVYKGLQRLGYIEADMQETVQREDGKRALVEIHEPRFHIKLI
ncbi:hypothetical protein CAEBREN_02944 [Caenorhabditis brenneri]|uniref:Uncharacterized protein n=1 Tax=Caenorhabditis brenneri TaxID=135651 RepID=G0NCQ1_CAEBE|nr:hypothetical protein CAEBREN_02944 [Caenorhabditis brenneri]